jgi:hypothetical protein
MNSEMRFLCSTTKKDEDEVDWLGEIQGKRFERCSEGHTKVTGEWEAGVEIDVRWLVTRCVGVWAWGCHEVANLAASAAHR